MNNHPKSTCLITTTGFNHSAVLGLFDCLDFISTLFVEGIRWRAFDNFFESSHDFRERRPLLADHCVKFGIREVSALYPSFSRVVGRGVKNDDPDFPKSISPFNENEISNY